jgi:hypothetical protein
MAALRKAEELLKGGSRQFLFAARLSVRDRWRLRFCRLCRSTLLTIIRSICLWEGSDAQMIGNQAGFFASSAPALILCAARRSALIVCGLAARVAFGKLIDKFADKL